MRFAPRQLAHLHQSQHVFDAGRNVGLAVPVLLQAEGDVLLHRHMRKQGIRLEHHIDRPLVRRQLIHQLTVEQNLARRRAFEAAKAAQQGGLAAPRATQQGENLTFANTQIGVIDGNKTVELLPHIHQFEVILDHRTRAVLGPARHHCSHDFSPIQTPRPRDTKRGRHPCLPL